MLSRRCYLRNSRQPVIPEQYAGRINQILLVAEHLDQFIREWGDFGLYITGQFAIEFPAGVWGQFVATAQRILNQTCEFRGCCSPEMHCCRRIVHKPAFEKRRAEVEFYDEHFNAAAAIEPFSAELGQEAFALAKRYGLAGGRCAEPGRCHPSEGGRVYYRRIARQTDVPCGWDQGDFAVPSHTWDLGWSAKAPVDEALIVRELRR